MFKALKKSSARGSVADFLSSLAAEAPAVGEGAYAFVDVDKSCRGWVQFIIRSDQRVEIHRLWTLRPGRGNGSSMLQTICSLADRHGIEIVLKPLPFGRKPYPKTREQLSGWYERHGFTGTVRKMIRRPAMLPAAELKLAPAAPIAGG